MQEKITEEQPAASAGGSWIAIRIIPSADRDSDGKEHDVAGSASGAAVIDALFEVGSQGVHEDGDAVVTHFPPDTDIDMVRAAIMDADPDASVEISLTPQVSWEEWRARVGAHVLGTLTVAPPWLAEDLDPATTIIIDPEMAFGTGEHPTTRGVVRLMQKIVKGGEVVADLGAGSAVLAIAAAKLGATRVAAIELDPDATANAIANISVNGVGDTVQYIEGDASVLLPLLAPVNIVLANIISSVLTELLPTIHSSITPDGFAILSGILAEERPKMMEAIATGGWSVIEEDFEEEWWSVLIGRGV